MYKGELVSAEAVKAHTLADVCPTLASCGPAPSVSEEAMLAPLLVIDTAGCGMHEG